MIGHRRINKPIITFPIYFDMFSLLLLSFSSNKTICFFLIYTLLITKPMFTFIFILFFFHFILPINVFIYLTIFVTYFTKDTHTFIHEFFFLLLFVLHILLTQTDV